MNNKSVQLSVALVTRNRPDSLERTLKSLRAQSAQPFEVVISDDSDAQFAPEVARLAVDYGCRYITGPKHGLYSNRNHVAVACLGTHVRTMDDDHEFPPDHMAQCLAACAMDPQSVWIIGEYLPGMEIANTAPDCPGQLHARGFAVTPTDTQNTWAISDGATIYPRSVFDHGIRYIDDFKFGASYQELGSRLNWLGYRIRQLDATYIVHHYYTSAPLNIEIDLSSRFCAMLCHSFIYQAAPKNQILCQLEILKQIVLRPALAPRALNAGLKAFKRRRNVVLQSKAGAIPMKSKAGESRTSEAKIY